MTDEEIMEIAAEEGIDNVTDERRPDNATIIGFARAILDVFKGASAKPAIAWLHTLDNTEGIEGNEPEVVITRSPKNPFGRPGIDYSETFPVTSIPLYAGTPILEDEKNALDALLDRIDCAFESYERYGGICEFEGNPMIYADTLTEIAVLRNEFASTRRENK